MYVIGLVRNVLIYIHSTKTLSRTLSYLVLPFSSGSRKKIPERKTFPVACLEDARLSSLLLARAREIWWLWPGRGSLQSTQCGQSARVGACFVVWVGSQRVQLKGAQSMSTFNYENDIDCIWPWCFVGTFLYPQAFGAGGLGCVWLAAEDMSASIEIMTKPQESFRRDWLCSYLHSKANPLH